MKKYFLYILFAIFELSLFTLIIILVIKIWNLQKGNAKGIQYVTVLNKDDITFNSSKKLKYFYEPKPNSIVRSNLARSGQESISTINSDTLNERFEYDINKKTNTFRIIILGDSNSFGWNVNTQNNFPEVLEDLLNHQLLCKNINKFEVINLSIYGYDIEYEVERYMKRGKKYDPDLIIWLIGRWNFEKYNELRIPLEADLKKEGIELFDKNSGTFPLVVKSQEKMDQIYGGKYIFNLSEKAFDRFASLYKNDLLIITLDKPDNELKKIIDHFIDLNDKYAFHEVLIDYWNDKSLRLLDYHPNEEGHKKIAQDLFNYIKTDYLSDCRYF